MAIKFSKNIKKEFRNREDLPKVKDLDIDTSKLVKKIGMDSGEDRHSLHYVFPFVFLVVMVFAIISSLFALEVIHFDEYEARAKANQFEIAEISPNRGIVLDRHGKAMATNVPAVSIYLSSDVFVDDEKLKTTCERIEKLIGTSWQKGIGTQSFPTLFDKAKAVWNDMKVEDRNWVKRVEILSGMSNEIAVKIKSKQDEIPEVSVEDGSKREYPYGESASLLIGYTGDVFAEDLEKLSYVSYNDIIGKSGIEKIYDEELFGIKGKLARERDSMGNVVENGQNYVVEPVSGKTLTLTIDAVAQKKMYEILRGGVTRFGADGGAAILEDIKTGEILVLASYPSFDSNKFVNGISQKDYDKLIKKYKNPLLNRAISAEVPPGSTFKTIIAASALDAKAITRDTIYISRRGYTFSNDKPFQEFNNNAYGALNLIDAIMVSSNIYFCEVIRNWDMDKLVPYLEKFGIGQYTGIDLYGEGTGRLPSPENKIALAKTTSPWLEPVWYPEGDSCNSVIGQGITTVTPIQMVNWVSAIANGGTLHTPHLAKSWEDADGKKEVVSWEPINTRVVKNSALSIVREGMWSSVNGSRRVITPLYGGKTTVAAKTGTAEFGRVNANGVYEHTHAWVTGFFPYENPKYSFVVFLEDGGASNNSATLAREFIDWFQK